MNKDHNYTSILTLPESQVKAAVRKYVEEGHSGAAFERLPVLGVVLQHRESEAGREFQAHVTIQTGGF